ncbi:MAG: DUF1295 domain-containing protein [Firmicutes bacterium]|nr:DUF1295 domain-containing protein [Bacillota bacterium]
MAFPFAFWILLAVSLVLCALGFIKFVYFLSVGFGAAIAGQSIALAVTAYLNGSRDICYLAFCALIAAYGIRLALFLVLREHGDKNYRESQSTQSSKPITVLVRIFVWISLGILYVLQMMPMLYRGAENVPSDVFLYIGIALSACGLIIQIIADAQKSASKRANPDLPVMTGIYRISRFPGYFGDILVWTGVFVSGIPVYSGWQWVISTIGYVLALSIIIGNVKRLERRQNKTYRSLAAYKEYASGTPILLPLIPVYHLVKKS